MNEIQSIHGLFVIEKGEKVIYKKFGRDFKGDKDATEDKIATLLEEFTYSKEQSTEVMAFDGFALIFKVFKDFSIAILSDQDSENQVFVSEALTALERCLKSVRHSPGLYTDAPCLNERSSETTSTRTSSSSTTAKCSLFATSCFRGSS